MVLKIIAITDTLLDFISTCLLSNLFEMCQVYKAPFSQSKLFAQNTNWENTRSGLTGSDMSMQSD